MRHRTALGAADRLVLLVLISLLWNDPAANYLPPCDPKQRRKRQKCLPERVDARGQAGWGRRQARYATSGNPSEPFFLGGAEDSGSVLYYMCICFKGFGREVVEAKDATRVGGVVRSPASLTIQHMIGQLVEVKRVEDGAVFFSASAATICMTLRARSTSGTSFSARVMELLYL